MNSKQSLCTFLFPCGHFGTQSGIHVFIYFLSLLECNRMQVHRDPRGKKVSGLLPFAVETGGKESSVKYPGQPRSGTVGEEDLCVCPRPVPQGPSAWHPVSFLHAYSNPVGTGERPLDCQDPPLPQNVPILS